MSRYFNKKEIELLAPAGTFDIFKSVIKSKCDAVYFGGHILNMRMIRKGYNLTDKEVREAVNMAHQLGKKAYITLNNLFSDEDIEKSKDYLLYLNEVQPDALIIQDFSIFQLIKELNLNLNIHASVMMNVHNLEMINALEKSGISRVVLSRETPLSTVKYLSTQSDMEFEYFTHGDMCVTHGSQCHYSAMLFGMSSNRGRCLKPCRWAYKIKKGDKLYDTGFPLAVKDMCMYQYLPEMIESGITSFKLEGRMRSKDFIVKLVSQYGDALDRYINDPIGFDRAKDYKDIFSNRKRDLSTAYAFGNPGINNINSRYEGTGKFYSTGKVFSTPTEEKEISQTRIDEIKTYIKHHASKTNQNQSKLSVKVNNVEQAKIAINKEVDQVYLSGDAFLPDTPITLDDINNLTSIKGHTKIILGLPKMMTERHFNEYQHLLDNYDLNIDGLLITNLGALYKFKDYGLPLIGDYSLNIYNYKAANYYKELGLNKFTMSIEAPLPDFVHTLSKTSLNSEIIVHGRPTVMYLDHDLYNTLKEEDLSDKEDAYENLTLITDNGDYPVFKDCHNRNHILPSKELYYLPLIKAFKSLNITSFRVEGSSYTNEQLSALIDTYKQAINDANITSISPYYKGFTLGALDY